MPDRWGDADLNRSIFQRRPPTRFVSGSTIRPTRHTASRLQPPTPDSFPLHTSIKMMQTIRSAIVQRSRVALTQQTLSALSTNLSSVTVPQRCFSDDMGGSKEAGTVKWFDASKGFGFIVKDNGEDLFVHFTAIKGSGYRTLEEGQKVEFRTGSGQKGPCAQDVTIRTA